MEMNDGVWAELCSTGDIMLSFVLVQAGFFQGESFRLPPEICNTFKRCRSDTGACVEII